MTGRKKTHTRYWLVPIDLMMMGIKRYSSFCWSGVGVLHARTKARVSDAGTSSVFLLHNYVTLNTKRRRNAFLPKSLLHHLTHAQKKTLTLPTQWKPNGNHHSLSAKLKTTFLATKLKLFYYLLLAVVCWEDKRSLVMLHYAHTHNTQILCILWKNCILISLHIFWWWVVDDCSSTGRLLLCILCTIIGLNLRFGSLITTLSSYYYVTR